MIIGTCGFCSTGSSAVSDYLKEHNCVQVLDSIEFTIPYLADGLDDLEFHLMHQYSRDDSCGIAIPRFRKFMKYHCARGEMARVSRLSSAQIMEITDEYLDSITQIKWRGNSRSDVLLRGNLIFRYFGQSIIKQRVSPLYAKYKGHPLDFYPVRELEVAIEPENFYEETRKFIDKLIDGLGADHSKHIVLDQPFAGNNPLKSMKFFCDPKAIIVDRDPRDNYLFTIKVLKKKGFYMPTKHVQDFVQYYRLVRGNYKQRINHPDVLKIQFEDLVYNYDETTKCIDSFCGIGPSDNPLSIFNPEISMPNTQLFRRFPEYIEDIKYIEKELSEYLFEFDKYPKPKADGPMFMGKSPLNKKNKG